MADIARIVAAAWWQRHGDYFHQCLGTSQHHFSLDWNTGAYVCGLCGLQSGWAG